MNLRKLREDLSLSQKELAQKLRVSPSNIFNYETGRTEPSIYWLIKIADFFDVSIDYLVGRTDFFEEPKFEASSGLSKDETTLIKNFRLLDNIQQHAIMRTVKSFSDDNTSFQNIKKG